MSAQATLILLVGLLLIGPSACVYHPVQIPVPEPPTPKTKIPLRAALVLSEVFSKYPSPLPQPCSLHGPCYPYDTDNALLHAVERAVSVAFSGIERVPTRAEAFHSNAIDVAVIPEILVWENSLDRPLLKMKWTIVDRSDCIAWQETITSHSSWEELKERGVMPSSPCCSSESNERYALATVLDTFEAQFRKLLDALYASPWWERLRSEFPESSNVRDFSLGGFQTRQSAEHARGLREKQR